MTKTPTPTDQSKKQRDNIKSPPKTLITQLLRTDLGRSVGVTAVTQLLWLNRFTSVSSLTSTCICSIFDTSFNYFFLDFELRTSLCTQGPCKVRNETETKRNETKQIETKRNISKRNETDRNETKQIETKRNKTKRNKSKRNETNNMAAIVDKNRYFLILEILILYEKVIS